ncbi:MAG: hypothetical protein V1859_06155 [archaeon]
MAIDETMFGNVFNNQFKTLDFLADSNAPGDACQKAEANLQLLQNLDTVLDKKDPITKFLLGYNALLRSGTQKNIGLLHEAANYLLEAYDLLDKMKPGTAEYKLYNELCGNEFFVEMTAAIKMVSAIVYEKACIGLTREQARPLTIAAANLISGALFDVNSIQNYEEAFTPTFISENQIPQLAVKYTNSTCRPDELVKQVVTTQPNTYQGFSVYVRPLMQKMAELL